MENAGVSNIPTVMSKEEMQVALSTTVGVTQNLASSLAVLNTKVDANYGELSKKNTQQDLRMDAIEDRMQHYEDEQVLSDEQIKNMESAKNRRIAELLEQALNLQKDDAGYYTPESSKLFDRYFGPFAKRLWVDARKHSYCGHQWKRTKKRNFIAVMEFINGWVPYGKSVSGYIQWLDEKGKV